MEGSAEGNAVKDRGFRQQRSHPHTDFDLISLCLSCCGGLPPTGKFIVHRMLCANRARLQSFPSDAIE